MVDDRSDPTLLEVLKVKQPQADELLDDELGLLQQVALADEIERIARRYLSKIGY
jgi:hypothetical protein